MMNEYERSTRVPNSPTLDINEREASKSQLQMKLCNG